MREFRTSDWGAVTSPESVNESVNQRVVAARSGRDHVYFSVSSHYSRFHGRRPSNTSQVGLHMVKKKRQAPRAAGQQPAPRKKQKGRPKASASADAEQGSSTQPKKGSRAGQREPSASEYSMLNKRRYVATASLTACTPFGGVLHRFATVLPTRCSRRLQIYARHLSQMCMFSHIVQVAP